MFVFNRKILVIKKKCFYNFIFMTKLDFIDFFIIITSQRYKKHTSLPFRLHGAPTTQTHVYIFINLFKIFYTIKFVGFKLLLNFDKPFVMISQQLLF